MCPIIIDSEFVFSVFSANNSRGGRPIPSMPGARRTYTITSVLFFVTMRMHAVSKTRTSAKTFQDNAGVYQISENIYYFVVAWCVRAPLKSAMNVYSVEWHTIPTDVSHLHTMILCATTHSHEQRVEINVFGDVMPMAIIALYSSVVLKYTICRITLCPHTVYGAMTLYMYIVFAIIQIVIFNGWSWTVRVWTGYRSPSCVNLTCVCVLCVKKTPQS